LVFGRFPRQFIGTLHQWSTLIMLLWTCYILQVSAALFSGHPCAAHNRCFGDPSSRATRASFPLQRLTRLRCSYRFSTIVSVNPEKILGKTWEKFDSRQGCSPEIRSFQSFKALVTSRKPCIRKLNNQTVPSFFVFVAFPNMLLHLL
jgi:hypothetical protein